MADTHPTADPIDHDALRRKYQAEREKRLRPDANDQYIEPTGKFASIVEDPYLPVVEREPVFDEVTVALIGGGFAGLCVGARLKQAGIDDVRIIEGGGDVGGVWYWNRYPGAMCDTAAMIYLPLLEETGHVPSQKYVFAPEILEQAQKIAETFDLRTNALFSTQVDKLEWDDETSRWTIHTNRGDAFRAKFVAMGVGPLNKAKLPGIPGIETFQGAWFHTSRWDYDYTGGDPKGTPMANLADKRVGIIGTGATGVQCVPPLGRDSGELFVFQRTPSGIDERNNKPLDPEWFGDLEPGWQRKWLFNFATLQTGGFADEDLVMDGWTDITQRIFKKVMADVMGGGEMTPEKLFEAYEACDDEKMEEIRARVDAIVNDPATAESLKPWYRQLCKRPCFHDEYLPTYNLPNVHLIDTDGRGVERIDENGVWANGVHYELDCLVFASGFEFATDFKRRSGYETYGRDGLALSDHWDEGMRTLHGMHVRNFPNLFVLGFTQAANLFSNITHNYTEAGWTVADIVTHALESGADQVECTAEAEANWVRQFDEGTNALMGNQECTPGYYNAEGKEFGIREKRNTGAYPAGPVAFFQLMEQWRAKGTFDGLEFDGQSVTTTR